MKRPTVETLHLLNRLAFGGRIQDLSMENSLVWKSHAQAVEELFHNIPPYTKLKSRSKEFMLDASEWASVEENRRVYPNSFDEINHNWLRHSAEINNPLREKAALFWMHFIPVIGEGEKRVESLLEIYRKHALGNLEALFLDLFLNPNFMNFLTAINSTKDSPNQNLAREFMELFTLGVNNYTETDVRELSRCFTGFVHPDEKAEKLSLNPEQIDTELKNLLGKKENFSYQQAIAWILSQPQTAKFITKRVLQFYLTDTPTESMVEECANVYAKSQFHFATLLKHIGSQSWFYNRSYMGNKVKTPIELLMGLQHQTGLRTFGLMCHSHLQRLLGQQLFNPPSVGGWPNGKNWLNGTILISRLTIPNQLIQIANRKFAKNTVAYKLHSWVNGFSIRHFRWQMDAKFDEDEWEEILEKQQLPMAHWLLGCNHEKLDAESATSMGLKQILQHPYYQYC